MNDSWYFQRARQNTRKRVMPPCGRCGRCRRVGDAAVWAMPPGGDGGLKSHGRRNVNNSWYFQRPRKNTRKRVMPPCGRCRRVGGDETTTNAWTDGSGGLLRDFIPLWRWADAVLLCGRRRFVGGDDPFTAARNAVSTTTCETDHEKEGNATVWAMPPCRRG